MEAHERFSQAIDIIGVKPSEIARCIGESSQTVNSLMRKQKTITHSLAKACEEYNISMRWIMTGKGNMFYNEETLFKNAFQVPTLTLSTKKPRKSLADLEAFETGESLLVDKALFPAKMTSTALYALQTEGSSMLPMLLPESWVVFEKGNEFRSDGLYVLNWQNKLLIRLLQLAPDGTMHILTTNEHFENWSVNPEEKGRFRIFGRVVRSIV